MEALAATEASVTIADNDSKPSWEEVDSPVSVSTKLSMDGEQHLGITLTETTEEYHSCPEDAVDTCTSVATDIESIQKDITNTNNDSNGISIPPKDIGTLFEMIGEITEKMKTVTTTTALIPKLQSEIEAMANKISSFQSNIESQITDVSSRVLVYETDIKELKSNMQSDQTYLKSHVKPAIKKLEKGGLLDHLSKDLLAKIETNEKSVSELKVTLDDMKNDEK